ncbi:hypothetical protein ACWCXH_24455 [Kitasatospora sp. NPDC001660]
MSARSAGRHTSSGATCPANRSEANVRRWSPRRCHMRAQSVPYRARRAFAGGSTEALPFR